MEIGISIHLMLWFNSRTSYQVNSLIIISIHLMLWFNVLVIRIEPSGLYFNTSYVVVQLIGGDNSNISRKNFNTSYVVVQPVKTRSLQSIPSFQYILCCGSTNLFFKCFLFQKDFNTSYVVVQHKGHFNTP